MVKVFPDPVFTTTPTMNISQVSRFRVFGTLDEHVNHAMTMVFGHNDLQHVRYLTICEHGGIVSFDEI